MPLFHLSAFLIAGLIVLFSFFEKKIQQGPVSEPLLAMIFGIMGSFLLSDFSEPSQWNDRFLVLHLVSEASIAMALMATALRLPKNYLKQNWKSMSVVLSLVLALMTVFAAVSFWVFLEIPVLCAILLGAIIAPTDPVIATSIVSGPVARERIPGSIRHSLSMESGANDGLAMPFVMLPILLFQQSSGSAWTEWLFNTLLWESIGAIVIGALVGVGAGNLLKFSYKRKLLTAKAFLMFSVALAFFVLAGLELVNANGIIGVFAAGLGLNKVLDESHELEEERVQEAVERLFTIPVFFIFGLVLPWHDWLALGWSAVVIPIVILLARRIPAYLIARRGIKNLNRTADFWFAGWFGPIGVAAILYALLAHKHLDDPIYWTIPSLIVFSSTLTHGITSGPYTKWYSMHFSKKAA
ncbi:NhaP-type Na+/H+ or K+/H+ antiporter [Cyclobacterium lianum]|uniref:NhaP-type Na+/H+ or K+/H+ antiporter n=1 Tax=Cyclobacterium lianum TaxID=388280 RepID=A0A1M7PYU8_9BACT|nr:cation:proton antiporter [Cyclobacterium lianum]SHN22921.1 NhaP-type Na+/H+ or K+/H+ antiporter [Cyclobacterium lianum]